LTSLRVFCDRDPDVSGHTGLRRLSVRLPDYMPADASVTFIPVYGLSTLTALGDLRLECDRLPLGQLEDLAPLTRLTQLAMTCVPPELPSLPLAARLRRLELQAFGVLQTASGYFDGNGADGAASAALAALASGAPLLERLRISVIKGDSWNLVMLRDYPVAAYTPPVELGPPLGPTVEWPSLTHLQVTPWAALLLGGCTFPRLSRVVATFSEEGGDRSFVEDEQLRAAVLAMVTKARDHAGLLVQIPIFAALFTADLFDAVAAIPGLRHLSWRCLGRDPRFAAARSFDWASLAPTLESLHLRIDEPLATLGYAEPLAALTGLTQLFLKSCNEDPAAAPPRGRGRARRRGGAAPAGPARAARAVARLPRLAHLRLAFGWCGPGCDPAWGSPPVAAALARCPALRLLEIDRPGDPLWRHEVGPARGDNPRMPQPSAAWLPFVAALRAGGCGAVVRPGPPAEASAFDADFDVEV
jgi:hypothetical protein